MMERNFYKVGNGLFAMEKTNGIVSVYDCGGQNQKLIGDDIDMSNISQMQSIKKQTPAKLTWSSYYRAT